MSLTPDKEGMDVVEIASSDDEEGVGMRRSNNQQVQTQKVGQQSNERIPPSEKPLSRSFWKAGGYVITPTKLTPAPDQLEHARVHPKFLHSNATSHKWAFGAIAELLDNAVDEICNGATFVKLDKIDNQKDNSPALLFQDDGGGMDPESVRKCMSLGYSSKKSNKTIGQYGNGFKTSTMRLGADVIVFSRASRNGRATQSIGLLSYTFLRRTGQDDVIVPMVDFDISDHWAEPIVYSSEEDWSANLKTILEWSPFASKEELMQQFEDIGPHGTKVIIYNLWLNDEGIFELNFDDDDEDIRLRDEANRGSLSKVTKRTAELQSHISYRIRYSLRAYASILYLRKFTNFQIILRGKPVQQFNIADELKYPKVVIYKPQHNTALKESPNEILCKCPSAPPANRWASVETTIGFIKEAPALGVSGFNVYNKNRLIRPFWKVTSDGSSRGDGVVGVLEANFIEPAHDKQDFERSSLFIRLETKLKQMLMDYWKSNCHLMGYQPPGLRVQNTQKEHPAQSPVGHAAHVQKEFPAKQHIVGLAPNTKKAMNLDHQPISSLPATLRQDEINEQPGNRCRTSFQEESPPVPTIIGLRDGSFKEVASVDGSGFISADKICEENIQLFMRCEERRQKENELKQTISLLERELEEAKKKCAQLASRLEIKRKQGILKSVEKIL